MIVICKQTYAMQFIWYYAHEDAMMSFRLYFTLMMLMLMLIPHARCILFWIYNSCKLLFLKSVPMQWLYRSSLSWANSLIIHEIVCIQRISLIFIFLTIIYLPFAKVRSVINRPMLRVYYLPSEELTFTLKFRENLLNKIYDHWA